MNIPIGLGPRLAAGWMALACLVQARAGTGILAARPVGARVTVLQTTDLHDHARSADRMAADPPARGGYARIAAYVASVRATAGHPVLLVDSGDWSMGTVYDLTLEDRPLALAFADALGYDCLTLGNHEFDFGPGGLARILAARGPGPHAPLVASNLDPGGDPELARCCGSDRAIQPWLVRTLANGVRVGFLGLMGRAAAAEAPGAAPARFQDYAAGGYRRIQARVDALRRQCDLVIALDHAGTDASGRTGEDVDLARHVTGIDLIASGHLHQPMAAARTVARGAWRTILCCAGARGTHVARVDLVCGPDGAALAASELRPMTGAGLTALGLPGAGDPAWVERLAATDQELDRRLGPVFRRVTRWPGASLYRPVADCPVALEPDDRSVFPAPNALGDLCADAFRAAALAATPSGRATVAVVATGELRGSLAAGVPATCADLYGLLPLGRSPDPDQADTPGEPLVQAYLAPDGLRELCALQLLAQAGAGAERYPHLSGLGYRLRPGAAGRFFRAVGGAAAGDPGLERRLMAMARAAIGPMWTFAAADLDCTGPAVPLPPGRTRLVVDRYALQMVAGLRARCGIRAALYQGPRGSARLDGSPEGQRRILANRLALEPAWAWPTGREAAGDPFRPVPGPGFRWPAPGAPPVLALRPFREVKAWAAVLRLVGRLGDPVRGAGGRIPPEYASSADFRRFPGSGAAVRRRNAGYPLDRIQDLAARIQEMAARRPSRLAPAASVRAPGSRSEAP